MQFFFFISGFLLIRTKSIFRLGYWRWIQQKAVSLLVPYVLLSLLAFVPKYLLSAYTTDKVALDFSTLFEMLIYPHKGVWSHFWFIYPLLMFFAVFGIYQYASRNISQKRNQGILGAFVLIGLLMYFKQPNENILGIQDFARCFVFYSCGMLVSFMNKEGALRFDKVSVPVGILTIVICTSLSLFLSFSSAVTVSLSTNLVITMLMIICMCILSLLLAKCTEKMASIINRNVLTLYLYAWPCQAVVEICLRKFTTWAWYVYFPILFAIGITAPLLLVAIYKRTKIQNRFFDVVLGINTK